MGPSIPISEEIHATKHRLPGESFREAMNRITSALTEGPDEFRAFRDILLDMRFLPGGRIQAAVGAPGGRTANNCYVAPKIPDSMEGIMDIAKYAALTMRQGGGIGYDFSTLRPKGDLIRSLQSYASGPVSFMEIFDAVCGTIASAGHRRGAQMAVLRVDHPDAWEFVHAKQNDTRLTNFNISVGVTDEFMRAVRDDGYHQYRYGGQLYGRHKARELWEAIMRSTWDWAEPGVIFIDRINQMNNLWYCETIAATNPCGEQPLPPNGACLLGSFNLVRYVTADRNFNFRQFSDDIAAVVPAMDRVIDVANYPMFDQKVAHQSTRRMGLGVTGVANAIEAMGFHYGSAGFCDVLRAILTCLRDTAYTTSALLAKERGPFLLYRRSEYAKGPFINSLPEGVRKLIWEYGIRNSHLLSIAPTGTISLAADNISSGIEPVFATEYVRTVQTPKGAKLETVQDYGKRVFGTTPRCATAMAATDHVGVLALAQRFVDSAVSKTVNVDPNMPWEEFKGLYELAWELGCKGITTFNPAGKRYGILNATDISMEEEPDVDGAACYIDLETGHRSCDT